MIHVWGLTGDSLSGCCIQGLEIQGNPHQLAHLELKQKEGERRGEGEEEENAEEKEKR